MTKTAKHWRTLDARIAQEVLGLHILVPISSGREWRDNCGVSHDGVVDAGSSHSELPAWQPHLDVTQALMVADTVREQGWKWRLEQYPGTLVEARFWRYLGPIFEAHATTVAEAFCLAVAKWLDAQKEKQNAETERDSEAGAEGDGGV